jgi:6-phosphogluconolactonase
MQKSNNYFSTSVEIYKPKVFDFETVGQLYEGLEDDLTNKIYEINGLEGVVRLAVSGGRSISPILSRLAKNITLPWEKLELFSIDERFVDKNDRASNQKVITDALGQDIVAKIDELNFFRTDLPIEACLQDFEEKLDTLDGVWFDALILGVGSDGHIASLFPGQDYLSHQDKSVVATQAPSYLAVPERVSLTVESILNSKEIILIVNGQDKNQILNQLLESNIKAVNFPVKFLLAHPNLTIYHSFDFEDGN